jgi:hypothetical protein
MKNMMILYLFIAHFFILGSDHFVIPSFKIIKWQEVHTKDKIEASFIQNEHNLKLFYHLLQGRGLRPNKTQQKIRIFLLKGRYDERYEPTTKVKFGKAGKKVLRLIKYFSQKSLRASYDYIFHKNFRKCIFAAYLE